MVEAEHLIQNPTSVEKIQLLAQYMRAGSGQARARRGGAGRRDRASTSGLDRSAASCRGSRSAPASCNRRDRHLRRRPRRAGQRRGRRRTGRAYAQEAWRRRHLPRRRLHLGPHQRRRRGAVGSVKPAFPGVGSRAGGTWPLPGGRDDEGRFRSSRLGRFRRPASRCIRCHRRERGRLGSLEVCTGGASTSARRQSPAPRRGGDAGALNSPPYPRRAIRRRRCPPTAARTPATSATSPSCNGCATPSARC